MLCVRLEHLTRSVRRVLIAVLGVAVLSMPANGQEAAPVAPFKLVAALLRLLVTEQACTGLTIDREALNRYLAENRINVVQLTAKGPYSAEVVDTRHKLRREFARHNQVACDLSFAMFGPSGTAIPGLLRKA